MTEFEALVNSLGEQLVDYIGKSNLRRLSLQIDEASLSTNAEVCLRSEDFDVVMHAIEKIGEVRSMFMDELSFEYVLRGPEDCDLLSAAPRKELVFAG